MVMEEGKLTLQQIKMTGASVNTLFQRDCTTLENVLTITWGLRKINLLIILPKKIILTKKREQNVNFNMFFHPLNCILYTGFYGEVMQLDLTFVE